MYIQKTLSDETIFPTRLGTNEMDISFQVQLNFSSSSRPTISTEFRFVNTKNGSSSLSCTCTFICCTFSSINRTSITSSFEQFISSFFLVFNQIEYYLIGFVEQEWNTSIVDNTRSIRCMWTSSRTGESSEFVSIIGKQLATCLCTSLCTKKKTNKQRMNLSSDEKSFFFFFFFFFIGLSCIETVTISSILTWKYHVKLLLLLRFFLFEKNRLSTKEYDKNVNLISLSSSSSSSIHSRTVNDDKYLTIGWNSSTFLQKHGWRLHGQIHRSNLAWNRWSVSRERKSRHRLVSIDVEVRNSIVWNLILEKQPMLFFDNMIKQVSFEDKK